MAFCSVISCYVVCLCVCFRIMEEGGENSQQKAMLFSTVELSMMADECVFVSVVQLGEAGGQSSHFVLNRIRLQRVHVLISDAGNAEWPINDRGVLFRYFGIAWWELIFSVC